jgi:hypothetical protein
MSEKELFCSIVDYLKSIGWDSSPVTGTYCPIRRYEDASFLISAAMPAVKNNIHLNVIIRCSKTKTQITFGILTYPFKQREEIYRLEYNDKHKWHLDSKKYNISHKRLKSINKPEDWKEAINIINQYRKNLPNAITDKDDLFYI